jgi:hypothetical protein
LPEIPEENLCWIYNEKSGLTAAFFANRCPPLHLFILTGVRSLKYYAQITCHNYKFLRKGKKKAAVQPLFLVNRCPPLHLPFLTGVRIFIYKAANSIPETGASPAKYTSNYFLTVT